jgi:hypothetical protein
MLQATSVSDTADIRHRTKAVAKGLGHTTVMCLVTEWMRYLEYTLLEVGERSYFRCHHTSISMQHDPDY